MSLGEFTGLQLWTTSLHENDSEMFWDSLDIKIDKVCRLDDVQLEDDKSVLELLI